MIFINSISKKFASKEVLKSITLHLSNGQTHAFIGSSGSGKSTLLRLISGLIDANSGEIVIGDMKVSTKLQRELASRIGYVIQEGGLFPHLTSRENIALVARTLKWTQTRIDQRITELTQLVQLDESLLLRHPKQLSGGQRQRVALMRALMLDPPLLLLDEPLGALDPLVRLDLQKELKRIFNVLKKTVIIVTHDVSEAAFFGHTVSLFHNGELIQHGPFPDFLKNPANEFVSRFIFAQTPPPELLKELWEASK